MSVATEPSRERLLRRGVSLNGAVIAWNVIEGIVAVAAGLVADSVALLAFGIDSFIEVASAAIVFHRLWKEWRGERSDASERLERRAAKAAGALLLLLAVSIVIESGRRLMGYGSEAETSPVGIALTTCSLFVMPVLGRAKLQTAKALGSAALRADAFETIACAWLSLATLAGLALNAAFGWAWADPLAALLIVPLVVREGWEGWSGEMCNHCRDEEP